MGLRIDPSVFPKPSLDEGAARPGEMRTIVLGGGLFWCTDAIYRRLSGVISVRPGYSGGTKAQASFDAVSDGRTQHTFVVEVVYEPAQIKLGQILQSCPRPCWGR